MTKRMIFGFNSARLYDLDLNAKLTAVPRDFQDRLAALEAETWRRGRWRRRSRSTTSSRRSRRSTRRTAGTEQHLPGAGSARPSRRRLLTAATGGGDHPSARFFPRRATPPPFRPSPTGLRRRSRRIQAKARSKLYGCVLVLGGVTESRDVAGQLGGREPTPGAGQHVVQLFHPRGTCSYQG